MTRGAGAGDAEGPGEGSAAATFARAVAVSVAHPPGSLAGWCAVRPQRRGIQSRMGYNRTCVLTAGEGGAL